MGFYKQTNEYFVDITALNRLNLGTYLLIFEYRCIFAENFRRTQ